MSHEIAMFASFLKQVKPLRKAASMSQRDLGELIGLDQGYVSRLERGAINPEAATLQAVAEALQMQIVFVPNRAISRVNSIISEYLAPPSGPHKPYEGSVLEDVFIPDGYDGEDDETPTRGATAAKQ